MRQPGPGVGGDARGSRNAGALRPAFEVAEAG